MYETNPITILSKDQQDSLSNVQREKTSAKTSRVSNYMSSDGIKSSVLVYPSDNTQSDKITNINADRIKTNILSQEPKKFIKNFKHIVDSKRAFYY